jgi:integrase
MAPATVRQVHAILRRALDQAARWGWIPANPAALASPPRLGSAKIRPPTPEEVSRLLETAYEADPDFAVLLWLAATTGARRGELCALRWGHVDLEAAELRTRLQDLRHDAATQLIAGGVDLRTVSGRIGHAGGGATTLRVYTHFLAAADRQAAEVLEKTLFS